MRDDDDDAAAANFTYGDTVPGAVAVGIFLLMCLSCIIVASYHLYTSQRIMYDLIITLFYIPTNVVVIMLWMMTGFR